MIYEFRTYEATPGNMPALNKHLEVAAGLFQKHGLGVLGFWNKPAATSRCLWSAGILPGVAS